MVPTVAAQTLLVKTPDEVTTQVAPRQLGVTAGSEVVTRRPFMCTRPRRLDGDLVTDQTDGVEVGGGSGGRSRRCSELDGIIHAEVLQLNQLTLGHPALRKHTETSGERLEGV